MTDESQVAAVEASLQPCIPPQKVEKTARLVLDNVRMCELGHPQDGGA